MSVVEGGDFADAEAFGDDGDDGGVGGVGGAEGDVGVGGDQLGHAGIVVELEVDDGEGPLDIDWRKAASTRAPPVRPRGWPTSATTGAGTRIGRRAVCRLAKRSVQALLC
jgi:hypothetical protein